MSDIVADVVDVAGRLGDLLDLCDGEITDLWAEARDLDPAQPMPSEFAQRVMDAMRRAERHMIAAYQAAAPDAMRERSDFSG